MAAAPAPLSSSSKRKSLSAKEMYDEAVRLYQEAEVARTLEDESLVQGVMEYIMAEIRKKPGMKAWDVDPADVGLRGFAGEVEQMELVGAALKPHFTYRRVGRHNNGCDCDEGYCYYTMQVIRAEETPTSR
jgi:hypothetical protein